MKKGYLISIEGTEGCGKSTLANELRKYFEKKGFSTSFYREPGGTEVGEKIRKIVLNCPLAPLSEVFLYLAARRELTKEKIIPSIKKGEIIILDRFIDSTIAYQGYGRGLDIDWLKRMNSLTTQGTIPDITFLLLSNFHLGFLKEGRDRIEKEGVQFHEKVRKGYLEIAREESKRVRIIEVKKGKESVLGKVLKIVEKEVLPCLSGK